MIPGPHRSKGGAPALGATGPGQIGPFGLWPDLEDVDAPDLDGDAVASGLLEPTAADPVDDLTAARLRANARDRVTRQVAAATGKRDAAKRKRARRAAARQHGLVSRHAAKLARQQQADAAADDNQLEVAADGRS